MIQNAPDLKVSMAMSGVSSSKDSHADVAASLCLAIAFSEGLST